MQQECITALINMSNYAIDDLQRISVMDPGAPSDVNLNNKSTNGEFLSAITYRPVSSAIKQCDQTVHTHKGENKISVNSARFRQNGHRDGNIKSNSK